MRKRYIVDVDGTICSQEYNGEYFKATPRYDVIQIINSYYESGHEIIYWTARGSKSGVDYRQLTLNQLKEWGCKYDEFWSNKPSYDVWIDDKSVVM